MDSWLRSSENPLISLPPEALRAGKPQSVIDRQAQNMEGIAKAQKLPACISAGVENDCQLSQLIAYFTLSKATEGHKYEDMIAS
jgi:hypothetical protein